MIQIVLCNKPLLSSNVKYLTQDWGLGKGDALFAEYSKKPKFCIWFQETIREKVFLWQEILRNISTLQYKAFSTNDVCYDHGKISYERSN